MQSNALNLLLQYSYISKLIDLILSIRRSSPLPNIWLYHLLVIIKTRFLAPSKNTHHKFLFCDFNKSDLSLVCSLYSQRNEFDFLLTYHTCKNVDYSNWTKLWNYLTNQHTVHLIAVCRRKPLVYEHRFFGIFVPSLNTIKFWVYYYYFF